MTETKQIFNLVIIDASGSMQNKVEEVQGGLNQLFNDLKVDQTKQPHVNNLITVVDFSSHSDFRELYVQADPQELSELQAGDYVPRGMTALYDAIGKAFLMVPEGADGVLVTVFTDGMENDSKEWKARDIKAIIEAKEAAGWTITYMGTNQESLLAAERLGIKRDKMLQYADSKAGTKYAFDKMSEARKKFQSSIIMDQPVEDIFDEENKRSTAS